MANILLRQVAQDSTKQAIPDSSSFEQAVDTSRAGLEPDWEVGQVGRDLVEGDFDAIASLTNTLADRFIAFFPTLLSAILIFFILYAVYRFLGYLLRGVLTKSKKVDLGLENLLLKTYRIVGWSIIFVMVVSQFGVNITALIAGLSVVGIAVGFAAQDTVSNFISGITILIDRPFRVGHFIEIEGVQGKVKEITLRSTRLQTMNNQLLVLPNNHMINQKLVNHTMLGLLRIEIPFGIAYKEFPEQARKVVLAAVEGDARLHPGYPPTVVVDKLNDSSIDMILRIFLLDTTQEYELRFEYVEKVREALRKANIEIPFPHLQLHIDEAKGLNKRDA